MEPSQHASARPERRPVSLNPLVNLGRRMDDLPPSLWQGRVREAFWKTGALLSFAINIALLVILFIVAGRLFTIKRAVAQPLVEGLHGSFVQMDGAHIRTTITVRDEIPVAFDLPVRQGTVVTLSEPTRIEGATVTIQSGVLGIFNAPATVTLPVGTKLPITLDFLVPVDTTVPIELTVPVDIPLNETELHGPFARLRDLLTPYQKLLADSPNCWAMALWGGDCR